MYFNEWYFIWSEIVEYAKSLETQPGRADIPSDDDLENFASNIASAWMDLDPALLRSTEVYDVL